MEDTNFETELDEILMSIENSDEQSIFYMGIAHELNLQVRDYTDEESKLIQKSQKSDLSPEEELALKKILRRTQDEVKHQSDMVLSYLAQGNRSRGPAKLMIH